MVLERMTAWGKHVANNVPKPMQIIEGATFFVEERNNRLTGPYRFMPGYNFTNTLALHVILESRSASQTRMC